MEEEDSESRSPGGVWVDEKEEEEVSGIWMKRFQDKVSRFSASSRYVLR